MVIQSYECELVDPIDMTGTFAANDISFGLHAILLIEEMKTKQIDEMKRART